MKDRNRSGSAMITVMVLTILAAALAAMMMMSSGSQILRSRGLVQLEQAFYIAEGSAERAASYIAGLGNVPTTLRGNLGVGTYRTIILVESGGGLVGTLSGFVKLNPNNSSDAAFLAVLPDGSNIDQDDLTPSRPDFAGRISMALVNPSGAGTQDSLQVSGSTYSMNNANTYSFSSNLSTGMNARIYNTSRDANGRATGQWRMEMTSSGASVGTDVNPTPIRRETTFTIHSRGDVQGHSRSVTIRGLQTVSWAKYALWYNSESIRLDIKGGESFKGPVYANARFHFVDTDVTTKGRVRFDDTVATTQSGYDVGTYQPIFANPMTLNAPVETMATVDMDELKNEASLTLEGATTVRVSNATVYITNARKGWNNSIQSVADGGLIYVKNSTSGTTSTKPGNVSMSGSTNGMRLTVVSEGDIKINGHLRYKDNPTNNPSAKNALGLIAKSNVVVQTIAPNNLDIYAHVIAKTGGFTVDQYDQGAGRGSLNVYGGIVNWIRKPVWGGSSGYLKNYTYDKRFRSTPPPHYPAVPDEFKWLGWEG